MIRKSAEVHIDDEWMIYRGTPIPFPIPEGVSGPIYCLGDSHINILSAACPEIFISLRSMSIAAYSLQNGERNEEYISPLLTDLIEGGKILCCFGEIDCRHYIPKNAREQSKTIESLVSMVTQKYTNNFLATLQRKYRLIILGPYICPNDHNHYAYEGADKIVWVNPYEQILEAKVIFNTLLREFCEDVGICFVPIQEVSYENSWDILPEGTYFGDSSHLGACMVPIIFNAIKDYKWKGFDL